MLAGVAGETHEKNLARWARESRDGKQRAPLIQAATVILLRDGADGLETLMLRRNSKLAFVGGMWVFPGGRVDAQDAAGVDTLPMTITVTISAVNDSVVASGTLPNLNGMLAGSVPRILA